jgi:hypothetical protein
MTKQMIKALMANMIFPGVGYFVLKKWFRAGSFILAAIAAMVWLLWAFIVCIIGLYYVAAKGGDLKFNYIYLVLPFFAFILIWSCSYIDLSFFCKLPESSTASSHEDFEK